MATPTLPATNLGKGLRALAHCARHPAAAARTFGRGLAALYRESVAARSPLPVVDARDLVPRDTLVSLTDCHGRSGNVTLPELVAIASLVRARAPRTLLEIGTFDGNTTLQMAANAPVDARVFTLDLPPAENGARQIDPQDEAYITDRDKLQRKYARSAFAAKVTQWLGDSATFDFAGALADSLRTTDVPSFDFVFVDGSHSYDYVRSDTERILPLLAPGATVLWHDYTPGWPGVIRWLDELSRRLPLRRIAGTTLVVHEVAPAPAAIAASAAPTPAATRAAAAVTPASLR